MALRCVIEDLFLNPPVFYAIILLLYRTDVEVFKDALAHLGPYQTLTSVRYSDPGGKKYCFLSRHHTNLKNPHIYRFCIVTPHSEYALPHLAVWDFWPGFARARARAEFSLGNRYPK
jgi:hypothetical protein